MLTIREQQTGLFEVMVFLMAILAVVAAVAWSWYLILVLAPIMAVVPYATWREIRSLEQRNDPSRRPCQAIAQERSVSQGQTAGWLVTTETEDNSNNRGAPAGIGTITA